MSKVLDAASLHRLTTYIRERVKESRRLSEAGVADSIVRSHRHSMAVGQQILDELQSSEEE